MPRIVLLGTGTSVGKTYVARQLAVALAHVEPESRVGALKPIETGVGSTGSDAAELGSVCHGCTPPSAHPLYALAEPLTPHLAAQREGRPPIDVADVLNWVRAWEAASQPGVSSPSSGASPRLWTIVETAGGVFSPLAKGTTNFDLARALEPCTWVLVAADALGTLHDVTATLEALRARGRPPDLLVMSASRTPDLSTGTNAGVLAELAIAQPAAVLSRGQSDLTRLAELFLSPAEASPPRRERESF